MDNYIGESLAIGLVSVDDSGNEQMSIMHGVIEQSNGTLFFESQGHEPFEMADGWIERLKPVTAEMGDDFAKSKYCLVLSTVQK